MKYEVLFYESSCGICFTEDFLNSLPIKVKGKVARWIERLQEYGPDLPRPYADIVRYKIRELRIVFSSIQYRFLYFFYGKKIIITHGFIKKSDKVPENELERAERLMMDFQERVRKGEISL